MKTKGHMHGQALLALLVFAIIGITVTTAAVGSLLTHSQTATNVETGDRTRELAESGAENAVLRLIRNPSYTGETLTMTDGTAIVSVTGDAVNKTIVSRGSSIGFTRTIRATVTIQNNEVTVTSWTETF